MGEIGTRAAVDIEAELRRDNRSARGLDLRVFADALRNYDEASENIARNGAIVVHPRTGAPIENPYLKVQQSTGLVLARFKGIKADRVLQLLGEARGGGNGTA